MEYTIQNVVDFSAQGKGSEAKDAARYLLADKVRETLAGIRHRVGQTMFNKVKDPKNDENIQPTA